MMRAYDNSTLGRVELSLKRSFLAQSKYSAVPPDGHLLQPGPARFRARKNDQSDHIDEARGYHKCANPATSDYDSLVRKSGRYISPSMFHCGTKRFICNCSISNR